jgi:serine/threonine protein kinase
MQHVHKLFVVHRDIKPANIMLNGSSLVIIDFGLATFYVDAEEKHIPMTAPLKPHIVGSSKYASINVHDGYDAVRRDDIISLVYVLIAMLNGAICPLPAICTNSELEKTHVLHPVNQYYRDRKRDINQFPECVRALLMHVYELSFFEMPDYDTIGAFAQLIVGNSDRNNINKK